MQLIAHCTIYEFIDNNEWLQKSTVSHAVCS